VVQCCSSNLHTTTREQSLGPVQRKVAIPPNTSGQAVLRLRHSSSYQRFESDIESSPPTLEQDPSSSERLEDNPCRGAFLAALNDDDDRVSFGALSVLMAIIKVVYHVPICNHF
jgi:hypothetical protein